MTTTAPAAAAPAPPTRRQPAPPPLRRPTRILGVGLPLVAYGLFTLVPFYWMVVLAVRPADSRSMLPWPITFEHFTVVWSGLGFRTFFVNSVLVGIVTMLLVVVVAMATGYALARFRFRGRRALMLALLCSQFVPGAMLLIPLFEIFRAVGLINNLGSLVIAEAVFQLPLAALLMSGFVAKVPVELEEAAMVDGCTRLRAFVLIVLPVLRPGIVAVGSFAFIGSWNQFLFALMFLSDQDLFTIPVGLSYTLGSYNVDFGVLAAGGLIAAVPAVAVFALIQKYLVQGLTAGAVKG